MKPPPPMLPAVGCTTASANAVATAASTAVPPSLIASAPMRDAISFCDATIPCLARTGTDPAPSVIEMRPTAAATRTDRFIVLPARGPGRSVMTIHVSTSTAREGFAERAPRSCGGGDVARDFDSIQGRSTRHDRRHGRSWHVGDRVDLHEQPVPRQTRHLHGRPGGPVLAEHAGIRRV